MKNHAQAGHEGGFTVGNRVKRAKMIHKMQNAHKLKDNDDAHIEKVY